MSDQKKEQSDEATRPKDERTERLEAIGRELRQEYDETLRLARATAAHALRVGELLREARVLVPHGERGKWVKEHFPGDIRTEQEWRWMTHPDRVAKARQAAHSGLTIKAILKLLREEEGPPASEVINELEEFQEAGGTLEETGYAADEVEDMLDVVAAEEAVALTTPAPARYAESDEERDARDKSAEYEAYSAEPKVEVVMLMTVAEERQFDAYIRSLSKRFGTRSRKKIVFELVKRAAFEAAGDEV